jgi:hypothetical protein
MGKTFSEYAKPECSSEDTRGPEVEHVYKTEGSDNYPRVMLAMCSCGWQGEIRPQSPWKKSHDAAELEWLNHYKAVT